MARPVWSGSISFGLVNVGVGMYTATEQRGLSFHQFERGTNKRVRNKRVAEGTDREVDYDDVAKGYETESGEHVIVTQDELESVAPETSRTIAIDDFVELADIDPVYYARTYYLGPRGEEHERSYLLLHEAMKKAGLVGIATFVMRSKEYLAALRAADDVIMLHTMYFADEVREPRSAIGDLPDQRELPRRELDMAVRLIGELTTPWEPEKYHDTHRERVLELVKQKASGEEPDVVEPDESEDNVVDLMTALEQSIKRARGGRKRTTKRPKGSQRSPDLGSLSKKELYERAGELGVAGRSKMSKDELVEAVAEAS